jgi:hypothetical protein
MNSDPSGSHRQRLTLFEQFISWLTAEPMRLWLRGWLGRCEEGRPEDPEYNPTSEGPGSPPCPPKEVVTIMRQIFGLR